MQEYDAECQALTTTFNSSFKSQAQESVISGIQLEVTSENAFDMDALIASLINDASFEEGNTIVLRLVVEEEDGAARRRILARRLEEEILKGTRTVERIIRMVKTTDKTMDYMDTDITMPLIVLI